MKSYFGSYYPTQSEAVDATVLVFDKNLNIGYKTTAGHNATVNWLIKNVECSFDFANQQTKLRHLKNAVETLVINGNDANSFIKELQTEQQKPWHKKSQAKDWLRYAMLTLAILGVIFLLYLLIVPWLSEKMANRVSVKTEQQLGDAVYNSMNLDAMEDTAASRIINRFFDHMDVNTAYNIRISVVKDDVVNAFALPGGRIVVYSALLKKVNTYSELAALLSHEFTHVNNKHTTKSIFRRLGSKIFIGLLFGRFGSVASVLINNADDLKALKYSRSLEKEADTDGLNILMERKINPNGFIDLFTHLKESTPGSVMPEFLASHPDIDKRISHIKEKSANAKAEESEDLKSIFEQLK